MILSQVTLLMEAINRGIQRNSLKPLERCLTLICSDQAQFIEQNDGVTFFTSCGFCGPLKEFELKFLNKLSKIKEINVIEYPASSYISSLPDTSLLGIAKSPINMMAVNNMLSGGYERFQKDEDDRDQKSKISIMMDELYKSVPMKDFGNIRIMGRDILDFATRDISLTYKIGPERLVNGSKYFELLCLQSMNLLWLMVMMVTSNKLHKYCTYQCVYSSTTLFAFYASLKNKETRLISPLSEFWGAKAREESGDKYALINRKYCDIIYFTTQDAKNKVEQMRVQTLVKEKVERYIYKRTQGKSDFAYSPEIGSEPYEIRTIKNQSNRIKKNGGKLCVLYPSSPDELNGHLFQIKLDNADINHLTIPIFESQIDWMTNTIELFQTFRKKDMLIVRLHPRMAEDKRGLGASPDAGDIYMKLIKSIKEENLDRIKILKAESKISSYEIGYEADIILNGWSTIGLEMAVLGKKVINVYQNTKYGGGSYFCINKKTIDLNSCINYAYSLAKIIDHDDLVEYCITKEEAIKAYYSIYMNGLCDLTNQEGLLDQFENPCQISSDFEKVLSG